jgi:hypothetical protein
MVFIYLIRYRSILVDIKQNLPTVFMVAVLLAPEQQQEQLHKNSCCFSLGLELRKSDRERAKNLQLKAGKL